MKHILHVLIASMFLSLSGCGLEAAGTAATSASLKKQELEQGRKTLERAQFQINQASSTSTMRLEDFKLDQDTKE
jgi:curli biogenesis system outer membrane secretion channel CsgG